MRQVVRSTACVTGLVITLGAGPALHAQEDSFCGIDLTRLAIDGAPPSILFGRDDRQLIAPDALPWRAIGELVTPYSHCSGTLVDTNLVLTAAHCVADYLLHDMVPTDVRFYAGLSGGRYAASAGAVRIITATNQPIGDGFGGAFNDDWAFVLLDTPIGATTGTIEVYDLNNATLDAFIAGAVPVNQAGYSADIPQMLSGHLGCHISGYHADGWLEHDCDTVPGDSGSPLLIQNGRQAYVVAVASAVECPLDGQTPRNTAVDARAFYQAYRQMLRNSRVAVQVTSPEVSAQQPSVGHGSGPRIIRICETDC